MATGWLPTKRSFVTVRCRTQAELLQALDLEAERETLQAAIEEHGELERAFAAEKEWIKAFIPTQEGARDKELIKCVAWFSCVVLCLVSIPYVRSLTARVRVYNDIFMYDFVGWCAVCGTTHLTGVLSADSTRH